MALGWDMDFIYRAFLILLRLGAFLFFIPLFQGRGVPTTVRIGFALALTVLVAGLVTKTPPMPSHVIGLVGIGIGEVLVGLAMGLVVRIAFQVFALAGELIALKAGFMRDASFDPFTQVQASAVERLISQFAVVVFLTMGLHLQVFASFVNSFDVVSLGTWWPTQGSINALIWQTSQIFVIATQIAAPFIAMNFIINMTFAVLGKASPQINVFVTSFAVIIVAGLFVLGMTLDVTAQQISSTLENAARNLLSILLAR